MTNVYFSEFSYSRIKINAEKKMCWRVNHEINLALIFKIEIQADRQKNVTD